MSPSTVNNSARQMQADIREQHEDAEWIDLGDSPTYTSGTEFTITGDVTTKYHVGRRIKASGTTPFTVYGTIATSSYSSPNTTITVTWDSGTLDATLDAVALGIVSATNSSLGSFAFKSSLEASDIADGSVTKAKLENVSDMRVLGNVSGGATAPAEVTILDEDDMTSDSATALATQQSIKAYVDNNSSSVADATETTKGIVERATTAEAEAATDTTRYVSPAALKAAMIAIMTGTGVGAVRYAGYSVTPSTKVPGDTESGSNLYPMAGGGGRSSTSLGSGTWECLGYIAGGGTSGNRGTFWQRIS